MAEEIKQATLIKEGSDPRVVGVGSQEAQQAFGEGFKLPEAPDVAPPVDVAPPTDLAPPVPTVVAPTEPTVVNKEKLTADLTNTLAVPEIGSKLANKDFLNAAVQYSQGRDATQDELDQLAGIKTVKEISDQFGLGSLAPAFGTQLDETKGDGTVEEPKKEGVISAIDDLIASKQGGITDSVDTGAFLAKKQEAALAVEKVRQTIADKQLIDAVEIDSLGEKPIPMIMIQRQQQKYSADQYIDNLKLTQDYNNNLILSKMAEGNFLEAQRINKEIANDNYEIEKLKIDRAKEQGIIDDREQSRLDEQINFERELGLSGFIKIADPAELEGLTADQIFTDPLNGDKYRKPVDDPEVSSISEQLAANKEGFDIVDGKLVPLPDQAAGPANLSIGDGTITGFGSDFWEPGLDFVLAGGKGAEVKSPFIGTVTFAGDNGGFGNQVKIDVGDGNEIWLSHLDSMNVHEGDNVNAESIIGTQGNTGRTYSTSGGDGTHLDITMKKQDGSYYSAKEVAGFLGHRAKTDTLSAAQELQAKNLSVRLFGTRAGGKEENISNITDLMKEGQTIDEIEDQLRFSSESELFSGPMRDAAESIGTNMTEAKRENLFNTIDRSLEDGNIERTKEVLIKAATDSYGVDTAKQVRGTKRTVEFLEEIQDDLAKFEELGGKTGFFEGNLEKLANKVGKVSDPELKKMATKIQTAIQKYRRAMSGAAFSVPESKEYEALFPNIDKAKNFNEATVSGLLEVLNGDWEFAMRDRMGDQAFDKIFDGNIAPDDGLSDEDAYDEYLELTNQ